MPPMPRYIMPVNSLAIRKTVNGIAFELLAMIKEIIYFRERIV